MSTPFIKTHQSGANYAQPHFFILNKGLNSGKPLKESCANCFVFMLQSAEEREFYYWLLFGLWRAKAFHPFLRGSVIPFISLKDLKTCICESQQKATSNLPAFQKSVATLSKLEELELQYHRNLQLISDAKRAIFYQYMRSK